MPISDNYAKCLAILRAGGVMTSTQVCEKSDGAKFTTVIMRLEHLVQKGFATREKTEGGVTYKAV